MMTTSHLVPIFLTLRRRKKSSKEIEILPMTSQNKRLPKDMTRLLVQNGVALLTNKGRVCPYKVNSRPLTYK